MIYLIVDGELVDILTEMDEALAIIEHRERRRGRK